MSLVFFTFEVNTMKTHSLFWFCFVAAIVALSIGGCKKSSDIETNTIAEVQTMSPDQEQSEPQVTHTEVKGSLSKRAIHKVVRQPSDELRTCYEDELSHNPDLAGKIVCQWTISGSGDVTDASIVKSELSNENVERCILNHINLWKFPAPKGGGIVDIEYPFVFDSNEQSQREQQDSSELNGSLDKRTIQNVIKQDADKINECFEKEITAIPNVAGDIVYEMAWTISGNGEVIDSFFDKAYFKDDGPRTPADEMYNEDVEKCLLDIINHWKFPAPKGGGKVMIHYPFVYEM